MAEVLQSPLCMAENENTDLLKSHHISPNGTLDKESDDNLHLNGEHDSDEDAPQKRLKKRIQHFSDSDSDTGAQQNDKTDKTPVTKTQRSDSEEDLTIFKSVSNKSRIQKHDSSSDSSKSDQIKKSSVLSASSDSDSNGITFKSLKHKSRIQKGNSSSSDSDQAVKNVQQQMRMKNKRKKIKDKFKSLKSSRDKSQPANVENEKNNSSNHSSEDSDNEANSIENIKQKIKEKMSLIPGSSICDPDTSDEESSHVKSFPKQDQKKQRKIKITSPKPQRMSAKQAIENMQKIKSESNRMLREKEVSLPYHRPKALSLKDIMSRRKPALSSDGKSLPIKMNEDQLRQYAKMLEERQKEMKELWQSDTDEENDDYKSDDEKSSANIDGNKPNAGTKTTATENPKPYEEDSNKEVIADITAEDSDKLFDVLSQSIIEEAKVINNIISHNQAAEARRNDSVNDEQDSENNMTLVFDDSKTSVTEENADENNVQAESINENKESDKPVNENIEIVSDQNTEVVVGKETENNTEVDSQLISLHFDTEKDDTENLDPQDLLAKVIGEKPENTDMEVDAFSDDDDVNMVDIDNIIENAEIIRDIEDKVNSQVLIRDITLSLNPKLTGSPGMVIDLDDSKTVPKKSGVELLKERFTFFAKLKTPEEVERDKKQRIKPGNQHLRLKLELEEQMAEQRTLEWEKRLEEDKQHQKDLKELGGEESDEESDIDKLEAKLEENEAEPQPSESEEEELIEDDIDMSDKPRVKNPMLENEAEESDCDEETKEGNDEDENDEDKAEDNDGDDENGDDDESSDSESSESEEENQPSTKKGRILKAFEDSDDEDVKVAEKDPEEKSAGSVDLLGTQPISQDDVLTLAQRHKSASEDLFTSQGSSLLPSQKTAKSTQPEPESIDNDVDLGTQTFSILDSTSNITVDLLDEVTKVDAIGATQPNVVSLSHQTFSILDSASNITVDLLEEVTKVDAIGATQPNVDNFDAVGMCSGSFLQSLPPLPITQMSQSQPIGEDLLAMCTGKFYENEFISQIEDNNQMPLGASQEYDTDENSPMTFDKVLDTNDANENSNDVETVSERAETTNEKSVTISEKVETVEVKNTDSSVKKKVVDDNLKSILDELDDPEFDTPKPNKFFCGAKTQNKPEDSQIDKVEETQTKKKLIIDSDDEVNEGSVSVKKKKLKKRKMEKRALQISDDEEELSENEEEDSGSEVEEENEDRLVEYDSEENEIQVQPQIQKQPKKKRKGTDFFEQEAELTSEDEWVGSGDEDEAGLDRMEREEGDDENFHQGKLQRELGQIHMRDVLDQDKREVRIIQELLFEDGDLGGGGRQRKFKWKNLEGDEETGTGADELRDTQEEEFESEEQWRKQRHERETFLRQMQNNSELDDSLNVSVNRTTIIKANLMSKTVSMLLEENQPEMTDIPVVTEKKAALPSPKKPFSLLQQTFQGSILNRGKGALARLAALATPLALDDDAPKGKSAAPSSGRNFVFAAVTPEAPKVTKRKAGANPSTPKLVKKMKTEEKLSKSSLLDRMKM